MMRRRFARWTMTVLLVVVFVLLESGVAAAQSFDVDVSAPDEGALGETIQLTAIVHDQAGEPVDDVELVFFSNANFAGVGGLVELGEVRTNELGVAVFEYQLRQLGTHTITIEGGGEPNVVSIHVTVGGQLYESSERLALIPGGGGWTVTAVIAFVWSIMIFVGVSVIRVARRPAVSEDEPEVEGTGEKGGRISNWLSTATAVTAVMVMVAGGLVTLLLRSPNTHHNRDPEGYDRSAVAFVEGAYLYPDFGLAPDASAAAELGRGLFVTNGCAGCHGVDAQGTTTAKSPTSASYDWVRQVVRTGLPGMPAYSVQELNDTELNEIFAFLAESGNGPGG